MWDRIMLEGNRIEFWQVLLGILVLFIFSGRRLPGIMREIGQGMFPPRW